MNSEEVSVNEDFEYKKGIEKLGQAGEIDRSVTSNMSSDDENSDESTEENTKKSPTKSIETTAGNKDQLKHFQPKFVEVQESLDEIPSLLAQFNTELEMLFESKMVVRTLPSGTLPSHSNGKMRNLRCPYNEWKISRN